MSDDPTRPDLTPDELASAHVDGLATPEQIARIEADPDLQARVARLQAVRDAVRIPDLPPDPDRRDAAIAAALDAAAAGAPVVELASRRRAVRRLGWAAAVAAAVALALVLPRVLDRDSGSDGTTVAAAPKSAADSSAGRSSTADADTFSSEEATGAAGAGPAAGSTTTADLSTAPLTDLGAASDLEGLAAPARRALEPRPTAPASTGVPPSPEDAACLRQQSAIATTPVEPGEEPPTVILAATATVDGEHVLVLVVEQPDGRRELIAAKAGGCELLGTVGL